MQEERERLLAVWERTRLACWILRGAECFLRNSAKSASSTLCGSTIIRSTRERAAASRGVNSLFANLSRSAVTAWDSGLPLMSVTPSAASLAFTSSATGCNRTVAQYAHRVQVNSSECGSSSSSSPARKYADAIRLSRSGRHHQRFMRRPRWRTRYHGVDSCTRDRHPKDVQQEMKQNTTWSPED